MNALTCQQVEEQLDLLAAGECDKPTRRALERHLETCAACSASYAESRRLQAMLELQLNEAAQLQRLRTAIDATMLPAVERRKPATESRATLLPFARRISSLAALLLVTLGLALLLPQTTSEEPGGGLSLAAIVTRDSTQESKIEPAR